MKNIAILAAMGMEAAQMEKRIDGVRPEKAAGRKFLRGRVGAAEVTLHQTGWGMRNAEKGARALIAHARPEALVLYGISGGMMPGVRHYELFIAASSYPCSGKAAARRAVPTDEVLAAFAAHCLEGVRKAPVATSQGLILRKSRKARIVAASGAVCIDMESCAVARVALEMGVPLLVLRCISDTIEVSSLLGTPRNGKVAADKAAAAAESVIKALAANTTP